MQYVVGVDEAGRGPLAGPVAVGVVMVPQNLNIKELFPGVADSKKLTEKKREEIYKLLKQLAYARKIHFCVVFASAKVIDRDGITKAVRDAVWKGVRTLTPDPKGVSVLLDGLLLAPPQYTQKTIIRGDATEPIISLASIAAKVERDRWMVGLAKKFPGYGFEIHKGYGTQKHIAAIKKNGLCAIHRTTFKIGKK